MVRKRSDRRLFQGGRRNGPAIRQWAIGGSSEAVFGRRGAQWISWNRASLRLAGHADFSAAIQIHRDAHTSASGIELTRMSGRLANVLVMIAIAAVSGGGTLLGMTVWEQPVSS